MFKSIPLATIPLAIGVALISSGTSIIVTKKTIDRLDHSAKVETVVVKELPAAPKAEPTAEPVSGKGSLGQIVFDNERPIIPAGWKSTSKAVGIEAGVCFPVIGPQGQEVVVVELDGSIGMVEAEKLIGEMMEKDGWRKGSEYMSMWRAERVASISMMSGRNRTTYVIGTGHNIRTARQAEESFRRN